MTQPSNTAATPKAYPTHKLYRVVKGRTPEDRSVWSKLQSPGRTRTAAALPSNSSSTKRQSTVPSTSCVATRAITLPAKRKEVAHDTGNIHL